MNFHQWLLNILIKEQITFFPKKIELFKTVEEFIISHFFLTGDKELFCRTNYNAYRTLIFALKNKGIPTYTIYTEEMVATEWNTFIAQGRKEGALELIPTLISISTLSAESSILDSVASLVPEIETDDNLTIEEIIAELKAIGVPEGVSRICFDNSVNFTEAMEIFIRDVIGDAHY